jgi:hypothetical protein
MNKTSNYVYFLIIIINIEVYKCLIRGKELADLLGQAPKIMFAIATQQWAEQPSAVLIFHEMH